MIQTGYKIRRAENRNDGKKLGKFFEEVFYPEKIGKLTEVFFKYLPGTDNRYWFIVEDKKSGEIASALTLIPWTWQMEGIELKVAEMGIVGTGEKHRKKGLQKILNSEYAQTIEEEKFDISAIQGIPGFYHQFAYYYSVPLENHINIGFHKIQDQTKDTPFSIRKATVSDIPFLMKEDEIFSKKSFLSVVRRKENWKYLFSHSLKTEYGSDFWIIEESSQKEAWYFRISLEGFGEGLIISEVSEGITSEAFSCLLSFCRDLAIKRKKPFLRFNVAKKSSAGNLALSAGAIMEGHYAWQVRIPDPVQLLQKMKPVLEKRIDRSSFRKYSCPFKIDLYREAIVLNFNEGKIESIVRTSEEVPKTVSLTADLFPALCFGYRSWKELQYCRPDLIIPDSETGLLTEVLFPKTHSWIYCQY